MQTLELISIIIAALGSVAAAVSAFHSAKSSRLTLELYSKGKKEKLVDELNKILEIGIEYPYLETKSFACKWNEFKNSDEERYLRYDMYCNLLFNFIHHVCEYFSYNKEQIDGFIDMKTWLRTHKQNWLNPVDENENIDGYDEDFRKFVNSYLI